MTSPWSFGMAQQPMVLEGRCCQKIKRGQETESREAPNPPGLVHDRSYGTLEILACLSSLGITTVSGVERS